MSFSACILFYRLASHFFYSHAYFRCRFIILHFVHIFIFTARILECKYRLNVNHAYFFSADLRMYNNRLNVIVLGACVRVWVYALPFYAS